LHLGQSVELDLAIAQSLSCFDRRRDQRLADAEAPRLLAHEQPFDFRSVRRVQRLEGDAAQHMVAALGQQQFATRRAIKAGQRIHFLGESLRRQINRQRRGIGAKQRRRRRHLGPAARRADGKTI